MPGRAIGEVFNNLKSGKGLFGAELTQKVTRQAMDKIEEQIAEVEEDCLRSHEDARPLLPF